MSVEVAEAASDCAERPAAKVEEAVPVASMVPVRMRSDVIPPLKVEVAVVVAKMKSTVGAEVAPSVDAPVQYAKVLLIPPEMDAESSVPQTTSPAAFV